MNRNNILFYLLILLTTNLSAQTVSLDGEWHFTIDPQRVGEKIGWHTTNSQFDKWEKVEVPHCFSDEPRYQFYTGHCWYGKKINIPQADPDNKFFLQFGAVFYKADVYFNGKFAGHHEGGYTPFEVDISSLVDVGKENSLVVKVDNSYDTLSVPGAKVLPPSGSGMTYNAPFPWINYGGIIRSVKLIQREPVFIKNVKIEAEPDLQKGNAWLNVRTFITNKTNQEVRPDIAVALYLEGKQIDTKFDVSKGIIAANAEGEYLFSANIPKEDVKLWNVDHPVLYELRLVLGKDTLHKNVGFRKIEIIGNKFLLNGNAISLGGANRVSDYPGEGSKDPVYVLEKDLKLMKESGMVFQRIAHYATSEYLLDWADKYGMLIIGEAGNWGMVESLMANPVIREKYRQQAKEMIERDWNHPSIVGWSVGNEYQAQLPEGVNWTKDMYAFTRQLDATRPVTFASNTIFRTENPAEESSKYVDFISANLYGNDSVKIEKIVKAFPDKPLFISEFGIRADKYETEEERIEEMKKVLDLYRRYPIVGASLWCFNDYRSQYANTPKNGYRPWGIVMADRTKRKLYDFLRNEFSPVICKIDNASSELNIELEVRNVFPTKIIDGYSVKYQDNVYPLKKMVPGQSTVLKLGNSTDKNVSIYLIDPLGFEVAEWKIN